MRNDKQFRRQILWEMRYKSCAAAPTKSPCRSAEILGRSLGCCVLRANAGTLRSYFVTWSDRRALAKTLDPEDLNEITRIYYDFCSDAIRRFDGIIANYMGDGVMALFGYPRAHEDDAERAIHAGLSLVRALETSEVISGRGVSARVGIATGLVVVGPHGADPLTREKTVVGETPEFRGPSPGCDRSPTRLSFPRRRVGSLAMCSHSRK